MPTRTFLIDSSYRDRKLYPYVGDFVLNVNVNSSANAFEAKDPILNGFPYDAGQLQSVILNPFDSVFQLSSKSSNVFNFYKNSWIHIPYVGGDFYGKIKAYDPVTQKIITDAWPGAVPAPSIGDYYTVRFHRPLQASPGVFSVLTSATSSDNLSIKLPVIPSMSDPNSLVGKYVFILPYNVTEPYAPEIETKYQWALIKSYNLSTNTFILATPLFNPTPSVPNTLEPVQINTKVEILFFERDNTVCLNYQGTDVFNNARCSSTNILVSIPTAPLDVGYHGFIFDYPYLLVVIENSYGSQNSQSLVSNVPDSKKVVYVAPVSYQAASDAIQQKHCILNIAQGGNNVLINQRDSIRIQVLLPNGEPLQFDWRALGSLLYFNGLNFPIPSDPFANIQLILNVTT